MQLFTCAEAVAIPAGEPPPAVASRPVTAIRSPLVLYTAQRTEADQFFQHLKWVLQLEHVAGQDVVVIEKIPVLLVEARELPDFGA